MKTFAALSTALPQWEPATAPTWLSRGANRLPNVHQGRRFEEVWATDSAEEVKRRDSNEQVWAAARR